MRSFGTQKSQVQILSPRLAEAGIREDRNLTRRESRSINTSATCFRFTLTIR